MFHLDLKRAEAALAGGRLEEACRIIQQPAVREHRDGQCLVDTLIEALLLRAGRHINFDRLEDARHDANLAFVLGGRKTEVAETLKQIKALELSRIEVAISGNDFEFALMAIGALSDDQRCDPAVIRLAPLAAQPLAQRGFAELNSGRLDRACLTDGMLAPVRRHSATAVDLHEQLRRCQVLSEHIQAGHYAAADLELSLLEQTLPDAGWIPQSRSALANAIESIKNVLSGPIGLLSHSSRSIHRDACLQPSLGVVKRQEFSSKLLLQVDGIGSLLLHRDARLTIGSAASSSRLDLPIQTAGLDSPVALVRDGADYFAESSSPFLVNGKTMKKRLMVSGDQIALGSCGRIRFVKPVPASASAVLQLTGAGLARRDIRNVVMMADSLLFAKSGGHFNLVNEPDPIVVYCAGESLAIRLMSGPHRELETRPLPVGKSVVVGQTHFALVAFSSR